MLPLQSLRGWKPFRLDALGLLTLLGAEEVNRSIGRLVPSRWLEYMPLLDAFVVAGDRISDDIGTGLRMYNITQGFEHTSFSLWFERLIMSQDFRDYSSFIRWSIVPRHRRRGARLISMALATVSCSPLLVMSVLMADWWGLLNAIAIGVSILVRSIIVR